MIYSKKRFLKTCSKEELKLSTCLKLTIETLEQDVKYVQS